MRVLIVLLLLLAGCVGMKSVDRWDYPDGTQRVITTTLRPPSASSGESSITSTTNGVIAILSGAQSEADIQAAKNPRILYWVCGLVVLLGAVALAAPNYLISNKDAIIITGLGLAGFAVVRWVDAASGVMAWLLPVMVLGAGAYMLWEWKRNTDR